MILVATVVKTTQFQVSTTLAANFELPIKVNINCRVNSIIAPQMADVTYKIGAAISTINSPTYSYTPDVCKT